MGIVLSTGRVPEKAHVLSQQLEAHLAGGKSVDPTQLCIHKASAAWALYCDVYVLNDDGSLGDACLLAAVSALASLHLPSVSISKDGQVCHIRAHDVTPHSAACHFSLSLISFHGCTIISHQPMASYSFYSPLALGQLLLALGMCASRCSNRTTAKTNPT